MDIALMSMALSQGQVQQQASMSVMKMAMENAEQQAESVRKLKSTSDVGAIQYAANHIWAEIMISNCRKCTLK